MTQDMRLSACAEHGRLIHILHPDPATRHALAVLFRLDGFVATVSTGSGRFHAAMARRPPDAVILGQRRAGGDWLEDLKRFRVVQRAVPVFVLADALHVEDVVLAMKAGATDVFTSPLDCTRLLRAVRESLRHDQARPGLREHATPFAEAAIFAELTPRERDVLRLVSGGQSNKEAGRSLGISPRTIEVHRARVIEKLGARNTADLLRIVWTS